MMRSLRANAKWVMGIVAFFFVGWMIFGTGMDIAGGGSAVPNTVAVVNGQKIEANTFFLALRNEQERIRQQAGAIPTTIAELQALEDQVLEQLVQEVILRQELRRRGIRVTDQEVIAAARTPR